MKSNMAAALRALEACAHDLETFPADAGIAYLTADRLKRLAKELSEFGARDLLNTGDKQVGCPEA